MSRVVMVVGASGGLGSAIAAQFASEGERVVIHYYQSKETAEKLAKKLAKGPGETMLFQADVRDMSQVEAMVKATVAKWGGVDLLVYCAGVWPKTASCIPMHEIEEEDVRKYMDVDLTGAFRCAKAVAHPMGKKRKGHIIIMVASDAWLNVPGWGAYSMAKIGVVGFVRSVAREIGMSDNVQINMVCPGHVSHPKVAHLYPRPGEPVPAALDRPQTAEEVARVVSHLSSQPAPIGQAVFCDSRPLR